MRPGVIDDAECLRARALPKGRKGRRTKRNALVTRSFLVKKKKKERRWRTRFLWKTRTTERRKENGKRNENASSRPQTARTLVRLPSSNKVTYTGRRSDLDVHARSNKEKMATIRLGQEGLRERESDNAKVIECALIEN